MSDTQEEDRDPSENEEISNPDPENAAADKETGDGGGRSDGDPGDEVAVSDDGSTEENAGEGERESRDEDEGEGEDEPWERPKSPATAGFAPLYGDTAPPEPAQVRIPSFKDISALEIASLAGVGVLLLAALIAFASMWSGRDAAEGKSDAADARFKTSVDGKWMSLDALDTYWKEPEPNERVRSNIDLVPEVLVRLGTAVHSEAAYLKAVFRDEDGTIRGDVTSHRVTNGNFADTGGPEIRIYGTDGFPDELEFIRYASGNRDAWTVEIFEGPSSTGSDWSRLAFVNIEAKRGKTATVEN